MEDDISIGHRFQKQRGYPERVAISFSRGSPNPEIKLKSPVSPALQSDSLLAESSAVNKIDKIPCPPGVHIAMDKENRKTSSFGRYNIKLFVSKSQFLSWSPICSLLPCQTFNPSTTNIQSILLKNFNINLHCYLGQNTLSLPLK